MTPEQKIKWSILKIAYDEGYFEDPEPEILIPFEEIDEDNVDEIYDDYEFEYLGDIKNEFRENGIETEIPVKNHSRYYEQESVAHQAPDGSWVGWTYYFGGGKHGEPEAMEWMNKAYHLDCVEEEKLVIVRTFSKVEN